MAYPQYDELEQPLLKLLYEKGGENNQMHATETYEPLAHFFGLSDTEKHQTRDAVLGDGRDEPFWNNMVQWARRKLMEDGYLEKSRRGVWKLSSAGVTNASRISTGEWQHISYPDEVPENVVEGAKKTVFINSFERSAKARQLCIEHYGYSCSVCNLNLENIYGQRGKHFIHVHHIVPVSSIAASYVLNPIKDLRTVCPNCHAMLHRTEPPCSIEELRVQINEI